MHYEELRALFENEQFPPPVRMKFWLAYQHQLALRSIHNHHPDSPVVRAILETQWCRRCLLLMEINERKLCKFCESTVQYIERNKP